MAWWTTSIDFCGQAVDGGIMIIPNIQNNGKNVRLLRGYPDNQKITKGGQIHEKNC
jgi:hypothetical protein